MRKSPKTLAAGVCVVLTVSAAVALVGQEATGASTPQSTATAVFTNNLLGISRFSQQGGNITVNGLYTRLVPGNSYFTVIYANGNCDPAQAFPTGPFTAGRRGVASFYTNVAAPMPNLVAGTRSMSVRMADTAADLDGDGKTGPTDVVAVAGSPGIGLVECNSQPRVTTRG